MNLDKKTEKIQPMNKKQLANHYGISVYTLNKWLKPFTGKIGPYTGRCYTIRQVRIIYNLLGDA